MKEQSKLKMRISVEGCPLKYEEISEEEYANLDKLRNMIFESKIGYMF